MDEIEEIARAGFEQHNPGADWYAANVMVRKSWVEAAKAVMKIAEQIRRTRGSLTADLGEHAHAAFHNAHERWETAGEEERVRWRKIGEVMRDNWEGLGAME